MKNFDIGRSSNYDTATTLSIYSRYQDGFKSISNPIYIKQGQLDHFLAFLKDNSWTIADSSAYGQNIDCSSSNGFIRINKTNSVCAMQAADEESIKNLIIYCSTFLLEDVPAPVDSIQVAYYVIGQHGLESRDLSIDRKRIEPILPGLYPDINIDILYKDYVSAKESILFLTGKPGVGKTTFLRYALQKSNKLDERLTWDGDRLRDFSSRDRSSGGIAYVKDTSVLMQSQFWAAMSNANYDLMILDDLDFVLSVRENKDNILVSNLLSFSDGLFGSKTKILITTNTQVDNIDEALLRPGRCFDFLVLNPLSRVAALKFWCEDLKMNEENFNLKWPKKKTIVQSDLMSFYYRISNKRRDRDYVLNGSKIYDIDEKVEQLTKTPVGFK